jgi:hypothetical protein
VDLHHFRFRRNGTSDQLTVLLRTRCAPLRLKEGTRFTLAARKPGHALPPSSRSSKPADDSRFRFETIFAQSCRAWQISRSIESRNSPLAPGPLEARWPAHRAVGKTDTLDLSIETERRVAAEQVPKQQIVGVSSQISEWLRTAFAQFLSCESDNLTATDNVGEFKAYAIDRFKRILHTVVKTSLKTDSSMPAWAAEKVVEAWNVPGFN